MLKQIAKMLMQMIAVFLTAMFPAAMFPAAMFLSAQIFRRLPALLSFSSVGGRSEHIISEYAEDNRKNKWTGKKNRIMPEKRRQTGSDGKRGSIRSFSSHCPFVKKIRRQ